MLPPVLEIYIVWHPSDTEGNNVAEQLVDHFHGTTFSGLIGGAVEVYVRSQGWHSAEDAPRPIPLPDSPPPNGVESAEIVAIVPILGNGLAAALEENSDNWTQYIQEIVNAPSKTPTRVGVFPYLMHEGAVNNTKLGALLSKFQRIGMPSYGLSIEPASSRRSRDLAQGITQLISPEERKRLTVFISHTKQTHPEEKEEVRKLIESVRSVIANTRLQAFFDAQDLQPGEDWDKELHARASTSALLALRTDLYASREWCQREMLIAKECGMPIVILDALKNREERGSFLMDHVPRIPANYENEMSILTGLNLLVDECLKRALWNRQRSLADRQSAFEISWWAPHAPELVTLIKWLEETKKSGIFSKDDLRILHPDPPLGSDEKKALQQILTLMGLENKLDIMTPRMLAARGG